VIQPKTKHTLTGKWQKKFTGPFEVIKLMGPVNLLIRQSPRARPFVVHIDKVKPFIGEDKADENCERNIAIKDQQVDHAMDCDACENFEEQQFEFMYNL
jgi:hypothetical protein